MDRRSLPHGFPTGAYAGAVAAAEGEGMQWTWLVAQDAALALGDPDYEYWREAAEIEEWIADGAPPVAGKPPPPMPDAPARTEVPAVALAVSREQAAALLNVSVDYFDSKVKPDLRVSQKARAFWCRCASLKVG